MPTKKSADAAPKTETTLYRKYRPSAWGDVVGQEHITGVLQDALKLGNIAHAYLFSGPRGTGKTSVARILAREIGASPNDTYEMDAASQTGVDNIRELIDASRSLPFESPYKVYIIDEVHMLSKAAFNAFLKVLEEPPKHVVFILATTELDRVLDTIVSRCQTYVFKKPSDGTLRDLAKDVAKKEGYAIDDASAELVAFLGDGSFRDMHGILQKIMSFSKDKTITIDEVEKVTGAPGGTLVNELIDAIAGKDAERAFSAVTRAADQSIDMQLFLKLVLHKVRMINLLRIMPSKEKEFAAKVSDTDLAFLKAMGERGKIEMLTSGTIIALLDAYQAAGKTFIPELPLELALMKILKAE